MIAQAAAFLGAADAAPASAQLACETLCRELSQRMGAAGCKALLNRSVAQMQGEHPALREILIETAPELRVELPSDRAPGTTASAEAAAALTALLVAAIELLFRMIGEDMTHRLVDSAQPRVRREGRGLDGR